MKANEFVRRFGLSSLEIAKTLPKFNRYKYVIFYADEIDFSDEFHAGRKSYMFEVAEIKRLVESHEIVEHIGNDLEGAKQVYAFTKDCVHIAMRDRMIPVSRLEQAIADVEACKEVL